MIPNIKKVYEKSDGEASHVNIMLDGCTYLGQKLVQYKLSKNI
jgi:hypothetical protein